MPHDVVVSYSRRNREIADRLVALLRERGVDVWYDRMIKPGADWREEIANAISRSRIFLILFSKESNGSQQLRKELAIADRRELLIVPVRIEEVEPTGLFEYELARRQWFDIFADWRAGLPSVVDFVAEAARSAREEPAARSETNATGTPDAPEPALASPPPRADARRAFKAEHRVERSPLLIDGRGLQSYIVPVLGLVFSLAALVMAAAADGEMAGGVTVAFLAPIWSLAQLVPAAFHAPAYVRSAAINWLLRAFALWTVGGVLAAVFFGPRDLAAVWQVVGPMFAIACLGLAGLAWVDAARGPAAARGWTLPLAGTAVLALIWFTLDRNDFEQWAAVIGGIGIGLGGVGYFLAARARFASP